MANREHDNVCSVARSVRQRDDDTRAGLGNLNAFSSADRYERYAVAVEQFDELGEVSQRTGQAIDVTDNDDIDPFGCHISQ